MTRPLEIAQAIIRRAAKAGAREAEAFVEDSLNTSIKVHDGQVENLVSARGQGSGLRIICEGRPGFAYSTDFSEAGLDELITTAMENARWAAETSQQQLPEPGDGFPELDLYDAQIETAPITAKTRLARDLEVSARGGDPRISAVIHCSYQDCLQEVALVNTRGVSGSFRSGHASVSLVALASGEEEESQTGFSFMTARRFADINPQAVGAEAASRAVALLGARPVGSARVPVVFDPLAGAEIIGQIGRMLTGEAIQKGKSLFAGKEGQSVATPLVTLIDDGLMVEGLAASPFDGEGVASSRKAVIDSGKLRGFLHNTVTAARVGAVSTGNGLRGSFRHLPEAAPSNFFLAPKSAGGAVPVGGVPGAASPGLAEDSLWRGLPQGFYVMEVSGLSTGGLNTVSGDFSVGASGRWITNGELGRAVRGVTVAGNLLDLLNRIDAVGGCLRLVGTSGAPAFRVSELTISGKATQA